MQQASDQLRRTIGCDASGYRFAFRARDPAAAHRTTGRQAKLSFLAGAFRFDDFQYFRNDVAAAFNQNPVTDTQTQPRDLVFVVQGRARNSDAAELYRLQHRDRLAVAREHIIGEHIQPPLSHHCRVELANRAGRGVARIRKPRLALFLALGVNLFKDFARQVSFAAHFDLVGYFLRSVPQPERHAANRAHVRTHVFAARAIAARDAAHEQTVLVVDRKRETVDFQFGIIVRGAAAGKLATALVKRAQLFNAVAVVERQHRAAMDEFRKAL